MKTLPAAAKAYNRTPLFTNATVPQALLNDHRTKPGVWGLIQVEHGALEYTIAGDKTYILTPGNPGVVEPAVTHFVRPVGETAFFVEFYRAE
ncbi:MAG: DUF1971 domain-containing protein [Pseudomonadota bacterium]